MLKGYVDALRKGNGYQYICNNGHGMSKSELCEIIKEFDYIIKDLSITFKKSSSVYQKTLTNTRMQEKIVDISTFL